MISNVPGLQEDELLGGWLARLLDPIAVASRRRVGEILAGVEGANLMADLPMHLGVLADTLGKRIGLDAEEMIWRGTFLPLFAPFIDSQRCGRLRDAMIRSGPARPHSVLGAQPSPPQQQRRLRYCPRCRRQDARRGPAAWWRRCHQAPGVAVCPHHGTVLVESQFLRTRSWKVDYPVIEDATEMATSHKPDALSLSVARDIQWLLQNRLSAHSSDQLRGAYFEALDRQGFLRGDRLRRTDFLHAFKKAHDAGALRRQGLSFDAASPYSWPAKLVVGAGDCHPPIRHLYLIHFLGLDVRSYLAMADANGGKHRRGHRGPSPAQEALIGRLWPDSATSQNELARRLGVGVQTARKWATALGHALPRFTTATGQWLKKRTALRLRWLRLKNSSLGRLRTRALKWLSRNDASWLARHPRLKRLPACGPVDWRRRDRELVGALPVAVARLQAYRPFRRVTVTGMAKELGALAFIDSANGRLPRFERALARKVESGREFALRRIGELKKAHPEAPPWRIRDLASIPRPLPADDAIRTSLGYPPCAMIADGIHNHPRRAVTGRLGAHCSKSK